MTSLQLFAKQTRTSIGRELSVSFCCCFVVDHRGNTFKVLVIDKPLIGRRSMVGRIVFTFVFGRYSCRMCNKKIVVSMNSVICLGTCPIMQMSESMDVFPGFWFMICGVMFQWIMSPCHKTPRRVVASSIFQSWELFCFQIISNGHDMSRSSCRWKHPNRQIDLQGSWCQWYHTAPTCDTLPKKLSVRPLKIGLPKRKFHLPKIHFLLF